MKQLTAKIILFLLCLEFVARIFTTLLPFWYAEAWQLVKKQDIRYVFIGSSRVGCSILPDEFVTVAAEKGSHWKAVNLGRGYSTLTEHYWGLKNLSESRPGGLKDVTVFLEAPEGIPDLSSWEQGWFHPQYPELLANSLAITDLSQFWHFANGSVKQKTTITLTKVFASFQIIGYGKQLLMQAKKSLKTHGLLPAERSIDLVIAGGVKAGDASMSSAREYARQLFAAEMTELKPISAEQWQNSGARRIYQLISKEGGQFILYTMPISSVQRQPHMTDQGVRNRQIMSALLAADSINVLNPVMKTTDDDFPDLWHLRYSRAGEFSRCLAKAYLSSPQSRLALQRSL